MYFAQWHSGQWSEEYRRLCYMTRYFRPRQSLNNENSLTENGKAIYAALVAQEQNHGI